MTQAGGYAMSVLLAGIGVICLIGLLFGGDQE